MDTGKKTVKLKMHCLFHNRHLILSSVATPNKKRFTLLSYQQLVPLVGKDWFYRVVQLYWRF